MTTFRSLIMTVVVLAGMPALAADWITAPSYFTHDPQTGRRVTQYSPIGPVYSFTRPDYVSSGYRHTRSSIQVAGSADNYHEVETWGKEVRPYGEWRFPYRPYSVPYDAWGAPFAGGNFYGAPFGYGFGGPAPGVNPGNVDPYYRGPRQHHDGFYPDYDRRDRKARNYYGNGTAAP